ncbi:uncharacterized protein LOC127256178 [Andrographis paniculata]|uniref:uncharacterized protein LOC127256178 n=1 Tax=Andrographis paniculata TaxID=175694 RepID=UPI0021E71857|nr:uncharacterized protein LOC127256178 [Andrographis paniculata]XP_051137988.1 uncharacterized protein LOC127256178 [Andrographis paniculata]XP_051137989.1 uncharacterized protein LOC127256178 [Andrographis paniculata]
MQGSVSLEVMNSTNPELNWKTVTKGRRSRKSTARSYYGISKTGNSISPKRVGDFSGSDSDKFTEVVCGKSSPGNSENVPIKKRRHLLQTPLSHQESATPRTHLYSEGHEELMYSGYSSSPRISSKKGGGIDSAKVGFGEGFDHILLRECKYNDAGCDFFGIELLAAAASMDVDNDDNDNDKKGVLVAEDDSTIPDNSNASSSAAQSETSLNVNKSENFPSPAVANEGSDCSLVTKYSASVAEGSSRSAVGECAPKVNRQHWDLNAVMDAWVEPYDDNGSHIGDEQIVSIDPVFSDPTGTGDELIGTTCSEKNTMIPNRAIENDLEEGADEKNQDQNLSSDIHKDNLNQLFRMDNATLSYVMVSEEINSTRSETAAVIQKDCSSIMNKVESTAISNGIQTVTQDINVHYSAAAEISEPALDTCIQLAQTIDCKIENDETVIPGCLKSDRSIATNVDNNFPNEGWKGIAIEDSCKSSSVGLQSDGPSSIEKLGSKEITVEDSCKSSSAGLQCDVPSSSVGIIVSTFDNQHDSDVSQDDGDELTRFEEGYDSPYEDGELRASFSYSWKDNELENECVDYESDGRNRDEPNAVDYPVSEIVEDGSEGSHRTQRGNSSVKRLPNDSDHNDRGGKGSNAGSGTAVELSMEINVGENDEIARRRQVRDGRETVDVKMSQMDEYASKMPRGKLQSRIEARSSLDPNNGKDGFFDPQCRSRRPGFRPAVNHGDREGDRHMASWGSRMRYPSNYPGSDWRNYTRPRSRLDVQDPRQMGNYMLKGPHRPLMRSSSEREDYLSVQKRIPISRGVGSYGSRGHYSRRSNHHSFREDFDPLADESGVFPRYISSRRDQSFSPSSSRNAHMPLPRRKSRSRSRPRSPGLWCPQSDRILPIRRQIMRAVPFSIPEFAPDYGDGYISPPRNHPRWAEDHHTFTENHLRRRRLDTGRLKSNDYYRPMSRPAGRFPFKPGNTGRDYNYDDRRCGGGETTHRHRRLHSDNPPSIRRFRHNQVASGNFEPGGNPNTGYRS